MLRQIYDPVIREFENGYKRSWPRTILVGTILTLIAVILFIALTKV